MIDTNSMLWDYSHVTELPNYARTAEYVSVKEVYDNLFLGVAVVQRTDWTEKTIHFYFEKDDTVTPTKSLSQFFPNAIIDLTGADPRTMLYKNEEN